MLIVENLNALHDELNSHRDVNCTEGLRLVQLRIHAQQQWPSSGSPAAGIAIFAPVVHSRRGCSHPVSGRPSRHLQEAHHFRICRPSAVPLFISSSSKLTLRRMYALEIWKTFLLFKLVGNCVWLFFVICSWDTFNGPCFVRHFSRASLSPSFCTPTPLDMSAVPRCRRCELAMDSVMLLQLHEESCYDTPPPRSRIRRWRVSLSHCRSTSPMEEPLSALLLPHENDNAAGVSH